MSRSGVFWVLAVVITLAAAVWQRRTGPSHHFRTGHALGGEAVRVKLPRSHATLAGALVAVPAPDGASGTLHWRRYPTGEPFSPVPLARNGGVLAAVIPVQQPAGKVEYYVDLAAGGDTARLPAADTVILRYHGVVPAHFLVPHILLMFIGLLLGTRAGLGALDRGREVPRTLAFAALASLTVGGMIFGMITQKYAFGAYWTGVPFGWDLTDNKTLLMWIGWAAAGVALARRARASRALVVAAAVLTLAVYVVPHSMRGSQLDYGQTQAPAARP